MTLTNRSKFNSGYEAGCNFGFSAGDNFGNGGGTNLTDNANGNGNGCAAGLGGGGGIAPGDVKGRSNRPFGYPVVSIPDIGFVSGSGTGDDNFCGYGCGHGVGHWAPFSK